MVLFGYIQEDTHNRVVLEDVCVTFGGAGETEGGEGANDTEDVVGEDRVNLSCSCVWPEQLDPRDMGDNEFLLSGPREVSEDGLVDGIGCLQGQVVQKHGGEGLVSGCRVAPCAGLKLDLVNELV